MLTSNDITLHFSVKDTSVDSVAPAVLHTEPEPSRRKTVPQLIVSLIDFASYVRQKADLEFSHPNPFIEEGLASIELLLSPK